jgi:hypothetical protein
MPNVGFFGGHTVHELGPTCDMQAFFACIKMIASNLGPEAYSLPLVDRLYRRYVKLDDLQATTALVAQIRASMADIRTQNIEWNTVVPFDSATRLDKSKANLVDVFEKYFSALDDSISSARSFYEVFEK